ncbi:MAG TPA: hypothetical protein VNM48_05795 [Chloroflexota bacterium]|nr:hypothetical protein [Chloroflexota bacterium]
MARIYGETYSGPDGIQHHPYYDDETGESGEDLSLPEAPAEAASPFAAYSPTAMWGLAQQPNPPAGIPAYDPAQAYQPAVAFPRDQPSGPQIGPGGQIQTAAPVAASPAAAAAPAPQRGMSAYEQSLANAASTAAANDAAKIAYQNATLRGTDDDRALREAQQAWSQAFSARQQSFSEGQAAKSAAFTEAGVTGTYNGAPTWQAQQADRSFGEGQRQFNENLGVRRDEFGRTFGEGQRQFNVGASGYMPDGTATLARQGQENSTALGVLNMNANMTGPQNYLRYLRTLGNTPQGLTSLVNGLAGKFNLASSQGSAPGSEYERASVSGLVRDLNQAPQGANDASGAYVPAGNTWNAKNFGILAKNPTQIGLLQGLVNESGRDWNTEYSQFLAGLPKFGGPNAAQLRMG